jgi:hypothetical protein
MTPQSQECPCAHLLTESISVTKLAIDGRLNWTGCLSDHEQSGTDGRTF